MIEQNDGGAGSGDDGNALIRALNDAGTSRSGSPPRRSAGASENDGWSPTVTSVRRPVDGLHLGDTPVNRKHLGEDVEPHRMLLLDGFEHTEEHPHPSTPTEFVRVDHPWGWPPDR